MNYEKFQISNLYTEANVHPKHKGIRRGGSCPHNNGMYRTIWRATLGGLLGLALSGPSGHAAAEPSLRFPTLPSSTPLAFQQTLTGMLPGKTKEQRYTLSFVGNKPRLAVRVRSCPGPSLKGGAAAACKESFGKPVVSYEGSLRPHPYGVELWLSTQATVEGFPSEMTLTCLRTVVGVLPAGASLLSGDACKGDGPPPRWQPGTTQDVGLWQCQLHEEHGGPWSGYGTLGPLSFAAGAGVEWVFVNNDCAGQEGAFRQISPGL